MKTIKIGLLTIFVIIYSIETLHAAFSQDPGLTWQTLHTPHFLIHFHDGELELAKQTAEIGEEIHQALSQYFNWLPRTPTEVVLTDRFDFSNGWATPLPRNTMTLIVTPPDDLGQLDDFDNWMKLLFLHEYTHILHVDMAFKAPDVLRSIFGRNQWLFPNAYQPPWVLEGLATYIETDFETGVGRGQSSSFKALMRIEVDNGIKPIHQVNQPMVTWPTGAARYLYGVYFMNFLNSRYGDADIRMWVKNYSNNILPWFINRNSKQTFTKDMRQMWADFKDYLEEEFRPGIEKITGEGIVEGHNVSNAGYFTVNPRSLPNGDMYYIRNDFASHQKLMVLRNGEVKPEVVSNVLGDRFDLHPSAGIIMARIELTNNVNYFSDLFHIDPGSGYETRLTRSKRYISAAWSPDGKQIVAVHNDSAQKSLHLLNDKGEHLETLWQGHDKIIVSQPDWSPDGKSIVAAVWRPGTRWNLEIFSLQNKHWRKITHTRNTESRPVFTGDGKSILFVADYNGVYNVQKMNLKTGNTITVTNLVGGAFSVTASGNGTGIFYTGLNSNGYDVYYLDDLEQPDNKNSQSAEPGTIKFNPKNVTDNSFSLAKEFPTDIQYSADKAKITRYNALPKLAPTSWFPVFAIDSERTELGVTISGTDPINRHLYSLLFAYDFDNNWASGDLVYVYDRWNPTMKLQARRNPLRYRDTNGELVRVRMSDSITGELIFPLLFRSQQWSVHTGLVYDKESDYRRDASVAPIADENDQLLGLGLTYNSSKFYPKSISRSDGQLFRLVAESSDLLDSDFSGEIYTLDWRGYLALFSRHVLAARLVGGYGTEQPSPFRLGGTINGFNVALPANTIYENVENVFNKREYALRGYNTGLPQLIGRRMALASLEWRYPIALIERGWMAPPIGIHNIYGKVFYDVGDAFTNSLNSDSLLQGAGLEIYSEFIIGYGFSLDLRLGYARGFDSDIGEDQFYLYIGGTF